MATVIIMTSRNFTKEEGGEFVKCIGEAAVQAFHLPQELKDVYLEVIPKCRQTPHPYEQMTCFVYTAPGKSKELKRNMVQGIQQAAEDFFKGEKVNTVVIIKEHPDENVGAGGKLRADMEV